MNELFRVELGRRDHDKKIYCKVYPAGSGACQLMMLHDEENRFEWQEHVSTRVADIPGGVLHRCGPDCECFRDILYRVNIDAEVERIASKHNVSEAETRAALLLEGFCLRWDEAFERMETDTVAELVGLAEDFTRKTQGHDGLEPIHSNIVVELLTRS